MEVGKVALVTGGARVAVADVNLGGAEDVASGIEARGGQAIALAADVSQPDQIAPMYDAVLQRFGRLDILHNNYGILVNTVCPGVIDTAMPAQFPPDRLAAMIESTPLRRMGTADEVAKVVLFLASDLSSFVTGTHI